jgi:hypothetical protein
VPGLVNPDDTFWALRAVPASERADRDRIARLYACDCAERALQRERERGREPAAASWAAVEVARRFAFGTASESERHAAGAAARDAWAAASDAAWADASDAARAAAWAAEREWQTQRLRDALDAGGEG